MLFNSEEKRVPSKLCCGLNCVFGLSTASAPINTSFDLSKKKKKLGYLLGAKFAT